VFSRRILLATACAMLIVTATVSPAAAGRPTRPAPTAERPLSPEERAAADRKLAIAQAYLSSEEARAAGRATLACVSPTGAGTKATTNACYVPADYLPVSARDQVKAFYCGPAVGQVIANYAWAVAAGANRYTQAVIAGWMGTDRLGSTNAYALRDGLNIATDGSPRRPSDFVWVVTELKDSDRDGTFGDQLHDAVRANVSGANMPLAMSVKPHDVNGRFHLSSWPRPVNSIGHWISAFGWYGLYDGTNFSQLHYTDSSGDEGGGTGKYFDPMRHIAGMIMDHHGRFVW
jgi:hypothetical protein